MKEATQARQSDLSKRTVFLISDPPIEFSHINQRSGKQLRTLIPLSSILHIPSNALEKAFTKVTNYSAQEYASSPNSRGDHIKG